MVNREHFILWRDGLDEYLENCPEWTGSTKTLETVRSLVFEATPQSVKEISGIQEGIVITKSAELFGLLKTKQNTTTNSLSKDVEDRNGFELCRLMSRECDPRSEGTEMVLLRQGMPMGKHTCKTFDETYEARQLVQQGLRGEAAA